MTMWLNFKSLGRQILQMKIKSLSEIFGAMQMSEELISPGSQSARIANHNTQIWILREWTQPFWQIIKNYLFHLVSSK